MVSQKRPLCKLGAGSSERSFGFCGLMKWVVLSAETGCAWAANGQNRQTKIGKNQFLSVAIGF